MSKVRVTVATLPDAAEAARARSRLDQAGIKSYLAGDTAVRAHLHPPPDAAAFEIQVDALDAAEALQILDDLFESSTPSPAPRELIQQAHDEERPPSTRTLNAKRAFRAAIIGLLCPPVVVYASWLLLKVVCSHEELEARPRRLAWIAALLNVSIYVAGILLLLSPLLNPYANETNPLLFARPRQITGIWVRDDGSGEMKLWHTGKIQYREFVEPKCEFSGTWGLGDFALIFNVRRLSTPGHAFEQGRSYMWRVDHFDENEIVLHDAFGRWRYVRKRAER